MDKFEGDGRVLTITSLLSSKMGFDITIEMVLHMCNKTGKPYYYNKFSERIYDLPSIEVPQELRKYLVGRGHLFHAYTKYFNDQDRYNVSVEAFLEHYPSWDEVIEHEEFRDDIPGFWNEDDHIGFRDLLEWCMEQEVSFRISWSY